MILFAKIIIFFGFFIFLINFEENMSEEGTSHCELLDTQRLLIQSQLKKYQEWTKQ